jgi:hypothetical protein
MAPATAPSQTATRHRTTRSRKLLSGIVGCARWKGSRLSRKTYMTVPSRPEEFHPEPLTDPDLTLSRHPARATERRLPPPVENWTSSCCQLAHSQRR